jgi:arginine deiminase
MNKVIIQHFNNTGVTYTMKKAVCLLVLSFLLGFFGSSWSEAEERKLAVEADYETLRTAIVMSFDDSIYKSSEMGLSAHPIFSKSLSPSTIQEHKVLVDLLEKAGVQILQVRDLLQDAVDRARQKGALEGWIRETYPDQYGRILPYLDQVNADNILQCSDKLFYRSNEKGEFDPLFIPIALMYWSHDFAISTPKGVIIGNSVVFSRTFENAIARLIFPYAAALRDFPVVLDAAREGVNLDGGDVIVRDEKTLFVGVGNRSDKKAAPLLAKKLGMDVFAVTMPPIGKPNGMNSLFLHLDSIFNFVDHDKVVAIPCFLEKEYINRNPMTRILAGLAAQTDSMMSRIKPRDSGGGSEQIRLTIKLMPEVGWVTKYEADTGKEVPLGMKLVDYARSQGWKVIPVGGDREGMEEDKWMLERVIHEQRWQGANIVQLGPGRVIAFQHNTYTNEALRRGGIEVSTFPGELIALRYGGPHCLVLPLVRKKKPDS